MTVTERRTRVGGARYWLRPIGIIRSVLTGRADAPRQGSEGAPDAWVFGAGLEVIHSRRVR